MGAYRYSQRHELHWIVRSIHVAKIDLKLHACTNNRALLCAVPTITKPAIAVILLDLTPQQLQWGRDGLAALG